MKKLLLPLLGATLLATPALAADTYTLDPNHTNILWQVNHFGFSNPMGKMTKNTGKLTLDSVHPENSTLSVTIDMNGVMSGVEQLDQHLKGEGFFETDKFPTATFISTKVTPTGKANAKVEGNLTLHGVTKPVTLIVRLNKIGDNPIIHRKTAGFSASTTIKRSDFGIRAYLPTDASPNVSDEVRIEIESEANLS